MLNDGHWWESFFTGLWLDVQRELFDDAATAAHAAFCVDVLGLLEGRHVLDAPCGNGRIALELAARGCVVTGVDRSAALLGEARAVAAARGLAVTLVECDLRETDFEGTFHAALNFWSSFGYFDDVGNHEQLRVTARALQPGGRFLIDGHVLETLLPRFQERAWNRVGDTDVLETRKWNAREGCAETEWTLVRGAAREVHQSRVRIYSYRELIYLLESVGFTDFQAFSGRSRKPFSLGAERLCLVATKG